jgi:hypothetical protein
MKKPKKGFTVKGVSEHEGKRRGKWRGKKPSKKRGKK